MKYFVDRWRKKRTIHNQSKKPHVKRIKRSLLIEFDNVVDSDKENVYPKDNTTK